MELGLHLSNFTWPGGPATLAADLGRAAKLAEDVGFTKLSVMDHVWQIGMIGPPENDMLEAYTALGYLAAKTERIQLLAWVTAAIYRQPGLLAKAGHHARRALAGPRLARHRRRLERGGVRRARAAVPVHRRALRAARGDAADLPADVERQRGAVRRASTTRSAARSTHRSRCNARTRRSSSAAAARRKTLRMVAQYAQACNLFPGPELERKLDVLRGHCEDLGRDYDDIEKTVMTSARSRRATARTSTPSSTQLQGLAALGITHLHTGHEGRVVAGRLRAVRRARSSPRPPSCDAALLPEAHATWAGTT